LDGRVEVEKQKSERNYKTNDLRFLIKMWCLSHFSSFMWWSNWKKLPSWLNRNLRALIDLISGVRRIVLDYGYKTSVLDYGYKASNVWEREREREREREIFQVYVKVSHLMTEWRLNNIKIRGHINTMFKVLNKNVISNSLILLLLIERDTLT
jgi:hypothetical protein